MHPRFGRTTLRVLASGLLGLALVAGGAFSGAFSVFAHHDSNTTAASASQIIPGSLSHAIVRKGFVNLATLPAAHTQATAKPTHRSIPTARPLKTPAQLAAYDQYVRTHPGALPKATSSAAPRATNMYGSSYLPVKQAAGVGLTSADTNYLPPDQAIAAVGAYTMEGVNNLIEVFNGSMARTYGPWTPADFFAPVYHVGDDFSDPQFAYDAENSVILMSWLEIDPATGADYLDIAASKSTSPSPITNYYVYQVDVRAAGSDNFCDYPTMGYDNYAMYVTCVTFSISGGNFLGNNTFAFNLHNMKSGSLGTFDIWGSVNSHVNCGTSCIKAYRLSPAIEDGIPQAEWVVATDAGWLNTNSTSLTLCAITNTQAVGTSTVPTFTCAFTTLPLSYSDPADAIQSGTSATLYPGVGFKQISYRAGHLAFALPMALSCSGHAHDGIFWAEITPQLSTIAAHNPQQVSGLYSNYTEAAYLCNSGLDYFMPTLIASAENDLTLVYNVSSSSVFPSIAYTGRANTDAPGTMGQGHSSYAVVGSASNDSGRWGDYSACSLAGSTFSRGIVVCGGEYGGSHTQLGGQGWDTYLYRLRMQ